KQTIVDSIIDDEPPMELQSHRATRFLSSTKQLPRVSMMTHTHQEQFLQLFHRTQLRSRILETLKAFPWIQLSFIRKLPLKQQNGLNMLNGLLQSRSARNTCCLLW